MIVAVSRFALEIRIWASDLDYPVITFPRELLPQMRKVLGRLSVDSKRVADAPEDFVSMHGNLLSMFDGCLGRAAASSTGCRLQ